MSFKRECKVTNLIRKTVAPSSRDLVFFDFFNIFTVTPCLLFP